MYSNYCNPAMAGRPTDNVFYRAPRSNLIVIQTVPLEEEERKSPNIVQPAATATGPYLKPVSNKNNLKPDFMINSFRGGQSTRAGPSILAGLRPQDKWSGQGNDIATTASPAKPKGMCIILLWFIFMFKSPIH